jgi:8-oxo-dGTP pyrophosphatase MutT (NUDIX family)
MTAATDFLSRHTPLASGEEIWGSPEYPQPLRLTWYRTDEAPPLAYVTSVRAIVFRGGEVLVVWEPNGKPYIIPGGRCEAGESIEATVRREVLEEVGWALGPLIPLGFVHLRNLGPCPPDHPYPYPDAFQTIFVAEAAAYRPEALIFDEWVASSAFLPVAEARRLPLRAGELALLVAAVLG